MGKLAWPYRLALPVVIAGFAVSGCSSSTAPSTTAALKGAAQEVTCMGGAVAGESSWLGSHVYNVSDQPITIVSATPVSVSNFEFDSALAQLNPTDESSYTGFNQSDLDDSPELAAEVEKLPSVVNLVVPAGESVMVIFGGKATALPVKIESFNVKYTMDGQTQEIVAETHLVAKDSCLEG